MSELTLSSLISDWLTYYKKNGRVHLPFEIKNESPKSFCPEPKPQLHAPISPQKEKKSPVALKPLPSPQKEAPTLPQVDISMVSFFTDHFPEIKVIQPIAPIVVLTPVATGPIKDFLEKLSSALTQHITFTQCLSFSPDFLTHPYVKLVIAPHELLRLHSKASVNIHQLTGRGPACFALASPKDYLTNNDLKRTLWQQLRQPSLLKLF